MMRLPVREVDQESEESRDDTEELTVGPTASRRASRRQSQRKQMQRMRSQRRKTHVSRSVVHSHSLFLFGSEAFSGSFVSFTTAGLLDRSSPGLGECTLAEADDLASKVRVGLLFVDDGASNVSHAPARHRSLSRFVAMNEVAHRNGIGAWLRC